jgi:hypothetical protein
MYTSNPSLKKDVQKLFKILHPTTLKHNPKKSYVSPWVTQLPIPTILKYYYPALSHEAILIETLKHLLIMRW